MRLLLLALPSLALLGGCSGYAADYLKPKDKIVGPELSRYGLTAQQSQCVMGRLGTSLSVWQLRQLATAANSVSRGNATGRPLTGWELLWASRLVKDARVGTELGRATEACGVRTTSMAAASSPRSASPPAAGSVAPPPIAPAAQAPVWLNLGAAPTRQTIAVDASSIQNEAAYRQAWFRVSNPGGSAPANTAYLLRIDCTGKTINPMAIRKFAAGGAITENRSYGPNGEGALPVESGTIMEIAYLAMCT